MTGQMPVDIPGMWLRRAQSDLRLGEIALNTPDVMLEDACFHAQQCAEKSLKGVLSYLNIPFPRTHAIDVLLDLLNNSGVVIPDKIDEAFALTQYAVQTRYPGEWEPVDKDEAVRAIKLASEVKNWAEEKLNR